MTYQTAQGNQWNNKESTSRPHINLLQGSAVTITNLVVSTKKSVNIVCQARKLINKKHFSFESCLKFRVEMSLENMLQVLCPWTGARISYVGPSNMHWDPVFTYHFLFDSFFWLIKCLAFGLQQGVINIHLLVLVYTFKWSENLKNINWMLIPLNSRSKQSDEANNSKMQWMKLEVLKVQVVLILGKKEGKMSMFQEQ